MSQLAFEPFSLEHFAAVVLVLGSSVAFVWAVRTAKSARLERLVRWLLAIGCVAYEAVDIALRRVLPLHLCDVSILIAPVVLLTANRHAFELLYFWGIGGALQALATPTLTSSFPAPICIAFFEAHGLVIASALYATVILRLRPTLRSIPRVWLITVAYGLLMIPVNCLLGTNFLYVMEPPSTASLLDLMGPWPWYLLTLQPVILLVLALCYLPFFLRDRCSRGRVEGQA